MLCEASGKEGKDTQRTGKREWWSQLKLAMEAFERVHFQLFVFGRLPQHATTQARPIHNRVSPLRSPDKISCANDLAFLPASLTRLSIRTGHPCVRFPRLHGE